MIQMSTKAQRALLKTASIALVITILIGVLGHDSVWAQNRASGNQALQDQEPEAKREFFLDTNSIRFIGEVLSGTEYGKDKIAIRWATSPKLSTFGQSSQHPSIVKKVVKELNDCLPEGHQIEHLEPGDESSTIQVYFAPEDELEELAKELKVEYIAPNLGFYYVRWNRHFEIESATVLIAEDKLKGNRLQHYLLEEITQSLGFGGDSPRFSDSIFFENKRAKSYGSAIKLSPLDKKLIKFHYNHVTPGSHPIELGILLTQHWKE